MADIMGVDTIVNEDEIYSKLCDLLDDVHTSIASRNVNYKEIKEKLGTATELADLLFKLY